MKSTIPRFALVLCLLAFAQIANAQDRSNPDSNNKVNPVAYLDLRLGYRWTDNIELYGAIDNATNVPKPDDGNPAVYDILGRMIRGGVRFNY